MPLINIMSDIASQLGIRINDPSEATWLKSRINAVARRIHSQEDLRGCEREQIFNVGQNNQQISLPQYIEKLIAVRDYITRYAITQIDMRPRYMLNTWLEPYLGYPYYKWRIKQTNSPIQQDIRNAGYLTFSLPLANSKLFTLIVTGETANATRVQEVVTILVGETTKQTSNIFINIESIRKSSTTDIDVTVTDIDGNVLAVIPNSELMSQYMLVQVLDRNEYPSQDQLVEILFKLRFTPFENDYDTFVSGDIYDEVIRFKTLADIAISRGNGELAKMYESQAVACMTQIAINYDGAKVKKIAFGPNNVQEKFKRLGQSVVTAPDYRYPGYF